MIKKSLLGLALLLSPLVHADMYFDVRTKTCKTFPEAKDINQDEYNEHAADLYMDLLDLWRNNNYNVHCLWQLARINAINKAMTVNTPTARRFIADIQLIPNIDAYNAMLGFR